VEARCDPILELKDLTRTITAGSEAKVVVDRVSFRFDRGRIYTIVGASGAGKSSLLRLINRLDEPSSGRVLLCGQPTEQIRPSELRRRIGFLFQRPHLFEGTVANNLRYARPDLTESAIRQLAEQARVPQRLIQADAATLSVGEGQRVALARLLALEPEVILLDEPTSALDPGLTEGIEATFRDLVDSGGMTLIMVSHDPQQALRMGGAVLLVSAGRVAEHGPAEQVLNDPRTEAGRQYQRRQHDVDS
jgi:putative ABC transport system ATP-binding protein